MPRRARKKSQGPRKQSGDGNSFGWWLALVLLVLIPGWWIWRNQKQAVLQPQRATPTQGSKLTNGVVAKAASNPPPTIAQSPKPFTEPPPQNPAPPAISTNTFPRPPVDTLETQIALARLVISSGSLDGAKGSQTQAALTAFQVAHDLPSTGELDSATQSRLMLSFAPMTNYIVTREDLSRLQPISKTWLGKSQQSALEYETILELIAERGHASPNLIRRLNPKVNWTNVMAGTEVMIPNVEYPEPKTKAACIVISLSKKHLEVFDNDKNLLAHFPCSIAARFDKRPVGELHVASVAPDPDYTFNPEVFPESAEAREIGHKLILPPGPNNPVGTAWVGLDKPGYGMHGTPNPEQVGRTESHGCFRLANWNATYLVKLVWMGMPVRVMP